MYFRVESFPTYGSACGYNRELMLELAAERGGHPEDPRKDDPLDFVLWQPSAEDEPTWDSPWGPGRPGWHIECSTMARRLLGRPVDIHGGGSDLLFPHHESEIAQAEALPDGRPFVLQWVHTGAVGMAGTKMSKSLGNLAFVRDLLERFDGPVLRAFLLRRHYAEDWDFAEEDLRDYAEGLVDGSVPVDPMSGPRGRDAFFAALDDDLDTPEALAVLDRAAASGDDELVAEGRALLGLRPVAAPAPAS